MYLLKTLLTSLFVLVTCLQSSGQVELKTLKTSRMQKDLNLIVEHLEAHPDPFTKITEEEFNTQLKFAESKLSKEMDIIAYYKILTGVVASIKDGHSQVYMPKNWLRDKRKKHGVFPYEMFLSNEGELFALKSYGDDKIPVGSKILEINDLPIESFLAELDPYISYETKPFRNDQISEDFEFMLYLVFKQVDNLKFKIKQIKESEVQVSTIPYKEWKNLKKDRSNDREKKIKKGEPYDFKIVQEGIAKLDIFSFAVPDLGDYNQFLSETFEEIKKNRVHSLIIDVRGNYGGFPMISSKLFHYIHAGHFKTFAKSSMKISKPYRRSFTDRYHPSARFQTGPKKKHFVNIEAIMNGKLGEYVHEESFFNEAPKHEKHEFSGDCYLLIDRKSYSASSSFASTFQCYNMGYLIGEPTGGTKIFRANAIFKALPKTKLRLTMSTTKMYTTCYNQEDEPILPTVEVIPSMLDRVHNVDSQMNAVIRLIRKMQKGKAEQKN